ncbi:MAG: hypothetical protein AAF039_00280 [Bacteroidota bacterium]
MQDKPYIEFKKQRELGEILTDSFNFIKFEFKSFFGILLKIVGPYLFATMLFLGFYFYSFNGLFSLNFQSEGPDINPLFMIIAVLGLMVSAIAMYALTQAATLFFIKSYTENKGIVDYDYVRKEAYRNFWSFIGLAILVGLALIAGFMLCFIPGIYLYPPLMLSFSILVFMNKGVTDAFQYGFTLIKDNWWITFAALLVLGIIVAVIGYIFQIPSVIYLWIKMGVFSGEMDAESMGGVFDPVYILLNLLAYMVQFVLQTVSLVAAAFIFFNLNEKKNFTGTMERIQNLGKEGND